MITVEKFSLNKVSLEKHSQWDWFPFNQFDGQSVREESQILFQLYAQSLMDMGDTEELDDLCTRLTEYDCPDPDGSPGGISNSRSNACPVHNN